MADDSKERSSGDAPRKDEGVLPTTNNPSAENQEPPQSSFHPAVYIAAWISLSSSVIIFNKWILHTAKFEFPIFLTTWHLSFATVMTQLLARFTHMLDSRHKVPMTGRVYLRAVLPVGFFFSLSLICGNLTYLYLSVSFIQMLKATTPVAVLLFSWMFGLIPPNLRTLANVCVIVFGIVIASFGEIKFILIGFIYQMSGVTFEALRLVTIQRLLGSGEFKMDPLVSLYYFAPACAVMNGTVALIVEIPQMSMADIYNVGIIVLFANATIAFLLNVSSVFLIGKTSSFVLTLCGVLKDILLVFASMIIFKDPVTGLQTVGYSVALVALVYYNIGGEKLKESMSSAGRKWSEYGNKHPAMRRVIIFAIVIFVFIVLLGGGFTVAPEEYQDRAKGYLGVNKGAVPSTE